MDPSERDDIDAVVRLAMRRSRREDAARSAERAAGRAASVRRALVRPPSLIGLATGMSFGGLSLLPSLLPRSANVQAAVSAACVLVGYAIGSLAGWVAGVGLGRVGRRPGPWLRRVACSVLALGAVVEVVAGLALWPRWQNAQRALVGVARVGRTDALVGMAGAVTTVVVLGLVGRFMWWQIRSLDRWFDLRMSHAFALAGTVVIVTVGGQILVSAVLWRGFVSWSNRVYGTQDTGTEGGVVRPVSPAVSGSPASLVPWDTLGYEGRTFVSRATTAESLHRAHGAEAAVRDPIRVYVGTRSAASVDDQAALAVRELVRTGAFDRAVLVVATATGTGWIDPGAATGIEQLYGGDTAIVSMQYSYLPSWIGILVDQRSSARPGSVLFNAVYREWARRPATARPKLLVFGESLGAYGAEAPFAGFDAATSVANLVARTDGALFAGPVSNAMIWSRVVGERDAGSPAWRPVLDGGRSVRVLTGAIDLGGVHPEWTAPRIAYLVHPSDPVAVFRFSTLWTRAERTDEPRGTDLVATRWFPIVTGVQSVGDLMSAFRTTPGHGHHYRIDFVGAWASVLPPPGWTDADTARLALVVYGA